MPGKGRGACPGLFCGGEYLGGNRGHPTAFTHLHLLQNQPPISPGPQGFTLRDETSRLLETLLIPSCQPRSDRPTGLETIAKNDSISIKTKHRRTLTAIFAHPTSPAIRFSDIEALFSALGGTVTERQGSRIRIELKGTIWRCHRPHPGKEAKRYQVEEARELLVRVGVKP